MSEVIQAFFFATNLKKWTNVPIRKWN